MPFLPFRQGIRGCPGTREFTVGMAPRGAFLEAIYFLKKPVFYPATESYGVELDEAPVQIHQAKPIYERS